MQQGMEEERDEDVEMNHVSKRARRNKGSVVIFDNADRSEYLSGFRKRKNKRRQIAEEQRLYKERQKRLQDRRERRAALQEARGGSEGGGKETLDEAAEEEEIDKAGVEDVSGTATYDNRETTTVVTVSTIVPEEEGGETRKHTSFYAKGSVRSGAAKLNGIKPKLAKFKKPKKAQSEKRMRKLTRREKSVPRNLRSRRDKKRKK